MTNKILTRKTKVKALFALVLTFVMSLSLFVVSACTKPAENASSDPSYTKSEVTDPNAVITNPTFSFGVSDVSKKDGYPVTSVNGWTISSDTTSSSVASGAVNVKNTELWKAALSTLYNDSDWLDRMVELVKNSSGDAIVDLSAIKENVKTENPDFTEDSEDFNKAVKDKVVDLLAPELNPSTHTDGDDFVL
ncbi:MAG: hypothetical protein MJ072_06600, partial [Clostridia bacterium]|nr:hypothetical protein [Clostridia bacterium]